MVYRREPGESLCVACADRDPAVRWRPSVRWERKGAEAAKRRAEKAAKRPGVEGVRLARARARL
jgi:hypothetical protein